MAVVSDIRHLSRHVGEAVTVRGWVETTRSHGKVAFVVVRDGTGIMQGVLLQKQVPGTVWEAFATLTQETSVRVTGEVREDARAPGGYEMTVQDLEIVDLAEEYPIQPKEHGVDFLLDHRHLWLRSSQQRAILRVRNEVEKSIIDFFYEREFVRIDTPILTGSIGEGASGLFETDYFGDKAYLAQTGQLYVEAAAAAFGKVYCFGPTFRAEKSKTRRHLTEFWMVEPEMAFTEHDESLRIQEQLVSHVVQHVLESCQEELKAIDRDITPLERVKPPFPRITYDEAVELLNREGMPFEWGEDFGAPHETKIAESFEKPVFITHYPAKVKAFYMKPDPSRPEVVLCADLIAPEGYGEIIGGSQRIDDPKLLEQRFAEHQLPRDAYEWYLDLRRYGTVPHSGFGLGLERTVAWICGLDHVRETIPFPRMLNRLYP